MQFKILDTLQKLMSSRYPSISSVKLEEFRAIKMDKRIRPAHGVIDGDYVQNFLNLPLVEQETILLSLNAEFTEDYNLQSLQKLLISLSKLH